MVESGGGQSITDSVILLPIFLHRFSHRHWTSTRTVQLLFKVLHVAECKTCFSGTMWHSMWQNWHMQVCIMLQSNILRPPCRI